jgi:hypothetical protein|tara:strand:- start:172 stop:402 length:231 start_codon:yes stop_codon:yes gene_type:complete
MCDEGLEEALELKEWLVVEGDQVDVGQLESTEFEYRSNRSPGKTGVVLDAGEPLFLGRSDNLAVDEKGSSTVVVEG